MKEADLIKYKNIPDELKREKRWCLYKIILRDGKNTKMPIMPNGKPAKSNDRKTWFTTPQMWKRQSALWKIAGLKETSGIKGEEVRTIYTILQTGQ